MEFTNVGGQYKAFQKEIDAAVLNVMESGHFILGPDVAEFEERFAAYLGVKHVISCGNGTDALQLLYMAYEIGAGDAVFVPDITFIASHEPACMFGAEAVFCDIDPASYNISLASLEEKIEQVLREGTKRPRAIVAVDFLGNPCDWNGLQKVADRYSLLLIEDAAQSVGGRYKGKKCGSFGDAAATSFFPTKPLGCFGDGGAVMTDDDELADVIRSLRVHGKGTSKYDNIRIGINSRLDTIQAAVLNVKLNYLDEDIRIRQEVAATYTNAFSSLYKTPHIEPDTVSAYAQYALILESCGARDRLIETLEQFGIPTLVYYPIAQHQLPVFCESKGAKGSFENSEMYVNQSVCLPFSPYMEKGEQARVIDAVSNGKG